MSRVSINELSDQIDMEYWLDREGIDYQIAHGSSGTQLNVRECPHCHDDRWKVYMNADTGFGNCFVCDIRYTKWRFISEYLELSGREVAEHMKEVAREVGWIPKKIKSEPVNLQSFSVNLPASLKLPINGKNMLYLVNRNIDSETAQYFNLRYSHNGVFSYKMGEKEMKQSYQRRIIIPIFDIEGKLVTFQGRDITGTAQKKYLFPPGLGSSGRYLYNAHNAVGSARVVVGEGVFDAMAIKVAFDQEVGLRDVTALATFGKHLSHGGSNDQLGEFVKLMTKGLKEVTFMWDGSFDAIDASLDAGMLVKSLGLVVKIAILPEDCDPNEVSGDVVRTAFHQARVLTPLLAAKIKLSHA